MRATYPRTFCRDEGGAITAAGLASSVAVGDSAKAASAESGTRPGAPDVEGYIAATLESRRGML